MLASVENLADFIGEPIPADSGEAKQATKLLEYASSLVEAYVGKPFPEGDVPPIAMNVTLAVASRGYTNFDGFTSESVDDWRGSGRVVEEAGLFLTSTEKKALDSLKTRKSPLGVISTYRGDAPVLTGWVPTDEPPHVSTPIPWG